VCRNQIQQIQQSQTESKIVKRAPFLIVNRPMNAYFAFVPHALAGLEARGVSSLKQQEDPSHPGEGSVTS
jgi:hypothetical protein